MPSFKFLTLVNFEYQLKLFDSNATSVKKDNATLTGDQMLRLSILTESTFLQMYAQLEAFLYQECEKQCIKKNASISRFESTLNEQGYNTNNEQWNMLIHLSKIRNCLLHGNGRLDTDRYGEDTRNTINCINSNETHIGILNLTGPREGTAKIKLLESFPGYCFVKIKEFIKSQS
jgi:hypothetical protein